MITALKETLFAGLSIMLAIILLCLVYIGTAHGRSPKAKFYDFSDQIIDGEIKGPTALYTDARHRVRFSRLLKLKKSFLRKLYQTSKEKVFK
tara:strand:- start:7949 stop:8224 length:276 start_codon:yes stop_codon:yes gene_type:complete